MPDSPVPTDEIVKEAYAYANGNDIIYYTLEINNAALSSAIYIVYGYDEITINGITYLPCIFSFERPSVETDSNPEFTIEFANASKLIGDYVDQAVYGEDPSTVWFKTFIQGEREADFSFPYPMEIKSVNITLSMVSVVCDFGDFVNKAVPRQYYTQQMFPGIFQ